MNCGTIPRQIPWGERRRLQGQWLYQSDFCAAANQSVAQHESTLQPLEKARDTRYSEPPALSSTRLSSSSLWTTASLLRPGLSIGGLLYRFRSRFDHGLRVAYYRDVVRPRILRTPPVRGLTDGRCEVHVLTSIQDWLNLLWTLKSFYAVSDRNYRLCIHDDGSLDEGARRQLTRHFPDARLIDRATADHEVLAALARFRAAAPFAKQIISRRNCSTSFTTFGRTECCFWIATCFSFPNRANYCAHRSDRTA